MAAFDYTQLHLFDKAGNEIPVVYNTNFKIVIPNESGDSAVFYAVSDTNRNIVGYHKVSGGNKFNLPGDTSTNVQGYAVLENGSKVAIALNVNTHQYAASSSYSSVTSSISIDSVNYLESAEEYSDFIGFPSVIFTTGISFDKISTGLVETQSLYVLVQDGKSFSKMSESTSGQSLIDWGKRYKLLFFLDNREDKDFRFFTIQNSDEIEWTNKVVLDIDSADENSYRINIGFTSDEEGIHEGQVFVCIVDTEDTSENGNIYPIGTINLSAEAVGEDERYRTLFTNFGVPDPKTYQEIFNNTDLNEGNTDNILLNQNSKKLFLSYSEIFPYAGTYKALMNAINVLGYQDLLFKEWYKNLDPTTSQGKYTTLNLDYGSSLNANTINNLTTSERVKLKKLNWVSMIYKINEQLESAGIDKYDFPTVKKVYGYNNADLIVKLAALRSWLEKYIIGLNCRIIEIGGEGVYFERYRLDSYSSYQTVLEWNNEKNIAPVVTNTSDDNILIDTSSYIKVDLGVDESNTTLEDLKNHEFLDFCEGYFDASAKYHHINSTIEDASTFVGGTLAYLRGSDTFEIKASTVTSSFLFNEEFIKCEDGSACMIGSKLKISNNEIFYNPYDLYTGHAKCSPFIKLPIIQIENANIRSQGQWENSVAYSIYPDTTADSAESYIIENKKTGEKQSTIDYVTFIPPTHIEDASTITITPMDGSSFTIDKIIDASVISDFNKPEQQFNYLNYMYGLKYSSLNPYNVPLFSIIGYQAEHISNNIPANAEFYLEIIDGKMLFPDPDNNREIYINFNFDFDTKVQTVTVNIVYHSNECNVTTYDDEIKHFIEGNTYNDFITHYREDPDTVIDHNFIHSIKVNNSGTFLVDVYERDAHNNIFAANCDNYGNIVMPHFDLIEYTNVQNDRFAKESNDASTIIDKFIDFCIYSPTALSNGISISKKDKLSLKYPTYSYSMSNISPGDYVHAVSITDMYRIDAIDHITKTLQGDNLAQSLYESYNLVLSANSARRFLKVMDFNTEYAAATMNGGVVPHYSDTASYDASKEGVLSCGKMTDYLDVFSESTTNFADVNIVFFNELNAHPLYQTYATMANNKIFAESPYNNKFRMIVPDDSGKSYVWCDLLQCTEGYLRLSLVDAVDEILQYKYSSHNYAYYLLSKFVYDTMKDSSAVNCISYGVINDLEPLSAFSEFIADCSACMHISYDASAYIVDDDIQLHMLGEDPAQVTNILYDIEAFTIENNDAMLNTIAANFYSYTYGQDGEQYGTIIGEHSPISGYISNLTGFNYESCAEYYALAANVACRVARNCMIDSSISSTDILKPICELYAIDFTVDSLTNKIYTTFDNYGRTMMEAICDSVHFDDLATLEDSSVVPGFGIIFESFIQSMTETEDASKKDDYYISVVYGLMVYVTVWLMNIMLENAARDSNHYHELSSTHSKKLYNRFAVCTCMSSYDTYREIVETSYDILKAFATVMHESYTTETTSDSKYIHAKDILTSALFDSEIAENISIYHKFINNAAYINYMWMNANNWVLTNKLAYCNTIDSINEYNVRCKFATTIEVDDLSTSMYYAKNSKYSNDGYDKIYNGVPLTAGTSILDLANKPYVSMYVKPIWMNRVNAYVLDYSSVKSLGLDPACSYLCVNYKNSAFTTKFKVGEKVKLVLQSVQNNEYAGQSTYEVVGYDALKNYMILKGTINSAYINNNAEELWGYLPTYTSNDGKTRYAMIPGANTQYELQSIENVKNSDKLVNENVITNTLISENTTYIKVHIGSNDIIIPVKYVKPSGDSAGYWLYQVYAEGKDNIAPYAVSINVSKVEKVNIFISYAHHGYVDYPMQAIDFNEYPNGTSEVEIEQTHKNSKYIDFIDDTFSIMSKHFDINEGVQNWMPSIRTGNKLNEVVPAICDSSIYAYVNTSAELALMNANIAIDIIADSNMIDSETSYKSWKVYYNDGTNSAKLLFESYNPVLFLASKLKGIYDVETTIYDKYGNESTHLYKGAYVIK